MIEIRRVANDREFIGELFNYFSGKAYDYFEKKKDWFRIQKLVREFQTVNKNLTPEFPRFASLLTQKKFLNSSQCEQILRLFVRNLKNYLHLDRMEIWKDGKFLNYNFLFPHIWEDKRLPHYYIIHDDYHQAYLLIDKKTGTQLPWILNLVCPSNDRQVIIGQHTASKFENYGICAIRILEPIDHYISIAGSIKAEWVPLEDVTKEKWDELPWIFPYATNFPHMYVPLVDDEDIYLRSRLKCMMDDREWTDEYEDEDQLDENTNDADEEFRPSFAQMVLEYKKRKKKDGESSDENADTSECDDDLPF